MRFMPPGAANIGEGVTRQQLRDAGLGAWSASCGRTDDVSAIQGRPPAQDDAPLFEDFDEVLPADAVEALDDEPRIELRFSGT